MGVKVLDILGIGENINISKSRKLTEKNKHHCEF